MVKFLTIALTAFIAIVTAQEQGATEVKRASCDTVNLKDKADDFVLLNNIVDVASSTGMLTTKLAPFDPLLVQNKTLEPIPVHLLGVDFAVTPLIKTLKVTGLTKTSPRKFEVESRHHLKTGVDFNGTIEVSSTLSFEIQQLHKRGWHICWTSLVHPLSCPPKVIEVEFATSVTKPSIGVDLDVEMVQCSLKAPAGTCTDLTVNDLISAAMNQKFDVVLPRILHRMKTVSIKEITLGFEKINNLQFHFQSSGKLATEISDKLLSFTTAELNSKEGDLYELFMKKSQHIMKNLGNKSIQEKFQSKFGNTCYDDIIKN